MLRCEGESHAHTDHAHGRWDWSIYWGLFIFKRRTARKKRYRSYHAQPSDVKQKQRSLTSEIAIQRIDGMDYSYRHEQFIPWSFEIAVLLLSER